MRRVSSWIRPLRTVWMGGPITSGLGFSTSFHKVGKSIPAAWAAWHFASNSL